jgi:ribonuclease P protein component
MAEPGSFRFRAAEHLRRPADFKRVYDRRRSVSDEWVLIYGCENGLEHLRLGLSVSRKFGNAVRRNRLRRLYREAFRLTKNDMQAGVDLVVIPRKREDPPLETLKKAFLRLVGQLAAKLAKETRHGSKEG